MTNLYSIKRDCIFLGIDFCDPLLSLVLTLFLLSSLGVYEVEPQAEMITILRPAIRHCNSCVVECLQPMLPVYSHHHQIY